MQRLQLTVTAFSHFKASLDLFGLRGDRQARNREVTSETTLGSCDRI